ncbi:hypothetical protein [Pseudophaeobacter sp.]|uniref:hypothetical protein n=1 Tax=Pseudophaeobacter sp. TaxID=1971739 RepID=UPI0032983AAF
MTKLNIVIHEIWVGSLNLIQALIVLRESDLTAKGGDSGCSHADLEVAGHSRIRSVSGVSLYSKFR